MKVLLGIQSVLFALIMIGSVAKLILLFIHISMEPEEQASLKKEIRNVLITAAVATIVSGGSITGLVYQYLNG